MRIEILHRQPLRAVDDAQLRGSGIVQETIEPGFEPGAVLDEHLRVGDGRDVLRRRRERLGRGADRHDVVHAHVLAADALHEGIERRDRRRDLDFSARRSRRYSVATSRARSRRARPEARARTRLFAVAARSEKLHRVAVDLKAVQRAQRFGKLLGRRAVDVFDAPAGAADRVVVMRRRARRACRSPRRRPRRAPLRRPWCADGRACDRPSIARLALPCA